MRENILNTLGALKERFLTEMVGRVFWLVCFGAVIAVMLLDWFFSWGDTTVYESPADSGEQKSAVAMPSQA